MAAPPLAIRAPQSDKESGGSDLSNLKQKAEEAWMAHVVEAKKVSLDFFWKRHPLTNFLKASLPPHPPPLH